MHIDDRAIDLVKGILEDNIEDNAIVLDLMSSWRTHWPEGKLKTHIVGLGLNAEEMADNPDLDDVVVQNLNQSPTLPFNDATFDAVIITVSVQYLINPFEVFKEVNRVLKSKGRFIVTFSNRMFPTKAILAWRMSSNEDHCNLVSQYFMKIEKFTEVKVEKLVEENGYNDPLYAVIASKDL